MRLSHILLALTVIAYASLKLGADFFDMRVVWAGVIAAVVVWVLEGLAVGVPAVRVRKES